MFRWQARVGGLVAALVVAAGCGGVPAGAGGNFIGGEPPVPVPGDGISGEQPPTFDGGLGAIGGLPCDVAKVLLRYCVGCHSTGNAAGLVPLMSRDDLLALSPTGPSYADLSLTKMQDGTMPTAGGRVPAADIATFSAWFTQGAKQGECTEALDAGVVVPVCTSHSNGTTRHTENMNPGRPCKDCHKTQARGDNFGFMGTVYPTLHETDQCNAYPTGTITVEILDANGNFALSMEVLWPSGNFMSDSRATTPSPYRARVMSNGVKVSEMLKPQTNGDCNVCHTPLGAQQAPGRVVF